MDAATPLRLIVWKYLDWCGKHRAPRTVEWYQGHLDGFLTHLGNQALRPIADLKPYHVVEWVDSVPVHGSRVTGVQTYDRSSDALPSRESEQRQ
jgi:hypothetical protein